MEDIDISYISTQEILDLKNKISCLSKNNHLDIFKLLIKHKVKYTENKNGIFINLTKLENKVLLELYNFVDFTIKNSNYIEEENNLRENFRDKFEKEIDNSNDMDNNSNCTIISYEEIKKQSDILYFKNEENSILLNENQHILGGLND